MACSSWCGFAILTENHDKASSPRFCEFSEHLARDYRGRGASRAAVTALIEAAAARGMQQLLSRVFPRNAASGLSLYSLASRKSGCISATAS
jgi:L-amino acid N-acyltransferase YncA